METIGLVGVGAVGERFVASLESADYDVIAYDVDSERVDVAVDRGAKRGESAVDVADRSDAVVLALPGTEEVRATVEDPVLAALAGGMIVDATTTHPDVGLECLRRCGDADVTYVAAPLTRGAPREGTLGMIGATETAYERAKPLLDALYDDHRRIGEVGAARRFKLTIQLRYALRTAVDAEAVAFARECDVDPAIMTDFLGMDVSERALEDDYATEVHGMGGLGIWHKDLGYALAVARARDLPLPLTAAGHDLYKVGRRHAGPEENAAEAVGYYWKLLGKDR